MQAAIAPYSVALLAVLDCASKREQRHRGTPHDSRTETKRVAAEFVAERLTRLGRPLMEGWADFAADVESHLCPARLFAELEALGELGWATWQRLERLEQLSDFHRFLLRVTSWLGRAAGQRIERGSLLNLFARGVSLRLRNCAFGELRDCFAAFRRFLANSAQPADLRLLLEPNHLFTLQHFVKQSLEDNEQFDFSGLEAQLLALSAPPALRERLTHLFRGSLGGYLEALQPGRVPPWKAPARFHAFLDASVARFFPSGGPENHSLIQKAVLLAGFAKLRGGNRAEALTSFADAIRFGQNNSDEKTIGAGLAFLGALHAEQLDLEEQASAVESFFALSIHQSNPLLLFFLARQQLALEGAGWAAGQGRAQPPIVNLLLKDLHVHLEEAAFDKDERLGARARPFAEFWNALHFQLMENCAGQFALLRPFFEGALSFAGPATADKMRGFFTLLRLTAEEDAGRARAVLLKGEELLRHNARLVAWEWGLTRLRLLHRLEMHAVAETLRLELEGRARTAADRLQLFEAEMDTYEADEEYWERRAQEFAVEGLKESLGLRLAVCAVERRRRRGESRAVLMHAVEQTSVAQQLGSVDAYIRLRVIEAWALAENDHLSQADQVLEDLPGLVHHASKATKAKFFFEEAKLRLRQSASGAEPHPALFPNLRLALRFSVDVVDFAAVKSCLFLLAEVLQALGRRAEAEKAAAQFVSAAKLQTRAAAELERCDYEIGATLGVCADCKLLLEALLAELL